MAGGHGAGDRHLLVAGDSRVHRARPEAKVAGLVAFVTVVALTPRHHVAAFAVDTAVLIGLVVMARLPARLVLARLSVVVPFLAVAALVPIVGRGEQVDVVGVALSREGLWAAWNIAAKALLGATASIVVAATTPIADLLVGLRRLHVPAPLVAITGFMFRYLDLLVGQLRRMRDAMTLRGHDPRWLWQARPIAASAGTLFVRSYERGERIHAAMLARGYDGALPDLDGRRRAEPRHVGAALAPAGVALAALVIGAAR